MLKELTVSIFDRNEATNACFRRWLDVFEHQTGIAVQLDLIPWSEAWSRLVEYAIYQNGPDLSETGSTWVADLIAMNALSPFSLEVVRYITEGERFLETAWEGCLIHGEHGKFLWALPWSGDVRVLAFWPRVLKQVLAQDAASAFESLSSLEQALAILKADGRCNPLALPTVRYNLSLHTLATWVWNAGGDFAGEDGREILFDQPQALEGIQAYFRLGDYLGEAKFLGENEVMDFFFQQRVAMIVSGYWLFQDERFLSLTAEHPEIASLPGHSFMGGTRWVVWKYSRNQESVVALLRFLNRLEVQRDLFPGFGLPLKQTVWDYPPFNAPPYTVFYRSLLQGRTFPTVRLWGMIEKRLVDLLPDIWRRVFSMPTNREELVARAIRTLAERLRMTLNSSRGNRDANIFFP